MAVIQQDSKLCKWCGGLFEPRKGGKVQVFCSSPCRLRWASAHRWDDRPFKMAPCAVCGTVTRQYTGKALCPGECRETNHRAVRKAWHDAQGPEYVAATYQRHKHKWPAYNAKRINLLKTLGSPHTAEAKIRARMDYFGHICWVCGAAGVERDHVKPLSKGGAHMPCNIRADLCDV